MGSKNNPAARGAVGGIKKLGGKVVRPVLYVGKYAGHGNYMAGQFENGQMIESGGIPTPFADIIPDHTKA